MFTNDLNKWIEAGEKIIELVFNRIGDPTKDADEYELIVDLYMKKSFKHYQSVVTLCKNGLGQDALVIDRVLIELLFRLKYLLHPTRTKEIKKRARQLGTSEIYELKKMAIKQEQDIEDCEIPPEIKNDYDSKISQYGIPDEWEKTCCYIAQEVNEKELYRTNYAYYSTIIHTNVLGFSYYIDNEKNHMDYSKSDNYCLEALMQGTRFFISILNIWRQKFGKIKEWELERIYTSLGEN